MQSKIGLSGLYLENIKNEIISFVDIIHADGVTGIEKSIGHKDYYPKYIITLCLIIFSLTFLFNNVIKLKYQWGKASTRF